VRPTRNVARSAQLELLNELSGPRMVEEPTAKMRKLKRKQKG
jgi:hypothetical protein